LQYLEIGLECQRVLTDLLVILQAALSLTLINSDIADEAEVVALQYAEESVGPSHCNHTGVDAVA
jgi:hypothetical protein